MKKILTLTLVVLALFASCATSDDDPDINGTWTLSTIDGQSVALLGGLFSMTVKVTNSNSYTSTGTILGLPVTETGTVTAKSDSVYTFTPSDGNPSDYTLSDDGDSLTGVQDDDGDISTWVFTKS